MSEPNTVYVVIRESGLSEDDRRHNEVIRESQEHSQRSHEEQEDYKHEDDNKYSY